MANVDVIMPQMGESITEGTLVKWLRKEGDTVSRDEPLFEISTEKVDVEIPAPAAGVLVQIKVKEGETVPVNTVVAVIAREGAAEAGVPAAARPAAAAPAAGAAPVAPVAPAAGGAVVALEAGRRKAAEAPESREERRQVRSSPLVRKIAREHGIDLGQVAGSGVSGRVTKDDILGFLEGGKASVAPAARAATPAAAAAPALAPAPAASRPAPALGSRVEPMSAMRKKIAEHMVHSRRTSAHVATVFEMDMTRVWALREKHKDAWEEKNGVKLTFTAFIARAVVRSLQEFPLLNASIDGDNVVYHPHVNLGIAVALDWGLIVPVIKSAEEKNLLGMQRAITDLGARARNRKLDPSDVQGGTFTITNPGIYGGLFGTPIISQPQVAILGIGAIEKRPVVIDDAIAIRPMSYFALSFDHRLIDGAVADQFMAFLKEHLKAMEDVG